jgi:hypothetical protein
MASPLRRRRPMLVTADPRLAAALKDEGAELLA